MLQYQDVDGCCFPVVKCFVLVQLPMEYSLHLSAVSILFKDSVTTSGWKLWRLRPTTLAAPATKLIRRGIEVE